VCGHLTPESPLVKILKAPYWMNRISITHVMRSIVVAVNVFARVSYMLILGWYAGAQFGQFVEGGIELFQRNSRCVTTRRFRCRSKG